YPVQDIPGPRLLLIEPLSSSLQRGGMLSLMGERIEGFNGLPDGDVQQEGCLVDDTFIRRRRYRHETRGATSEGADLIDLRNEASHEGRIQRRSGVGKVRMHKVVVVRVRLIHHGKPLRGELSTSSVSRTPSPGTLGTRTRPRSTTRGSTN